MKNLDSEILITNLLIKYVALEKILLRKGLISQEELSKEVQDLSLSLAKDVLHKANVDNIDQILSSFQKDK